MWTNSCMKRILSIINHFMFQGTTKFLLRNLCELQFQCNWDDFWISCLVFLIPVKIILCNFSKYFFFTQNIHAKTFHHIRLYYECRNLLPIVFVMTFCPFRIFILISKNNNFLELISNNNTIDISLKTKYIWD